MRNGKHTAFYISAEASKRLDLLAKITCSSRSNCVEMLALNCLEQTLEVELKKQALGVSGREDIIAALKDAIK